MSTPSPTTLTEDTLHALVDGQLGPTERAVAEALLAQDPQALSLIHI